MINTRILVAAGACLAVLVGSFALSRPDSQADGARPSLPPARVVGTVEPAPLPELGEASKLPALGREPKPKPKRRPAPVVVAPEPEVEEPVETEPEYVEPVEPEYVPPPQPVAPTPVAPPPEPAPEPPPPVYFDDSG